MAIPTQFIMGRDQNGYVAYTTTFPNDGFEVALAADTAQEVTIPTTASSWTLILSYGAGTDVFAALNDTATVPTGTIGSSTQLLNRPGLIVRGGDTISFITPNTGGAFVVGSLYSNDANS